MSYTFRFTFAMALSFIIAAVCLGAQGEHPELERLRGDLTRLEMDVHVLEDQEAKMVNKLRKSISRSRGTGIILFLFGAFCALWAQNTGRNAWLWFFLGFFLNFVAVLFLLSKNSQDIRDNLEPPKL